MDNKLINNPIIYPSQKTETMNIFKGSVQSKSSAGLDLYNTPGSLELHDTYKNLLSLSKENASFLRPNKGIFSKKTLRQIWDHLPGTYYGEHVKTFIIDTGLRYSLYKLSLRKKDYLILVKDMNRSSNSESPSVLKRLKVKIYLVNGTTGIDINKLHTTIMNMSTSDLLSLEENTLPSSLNNILGSLFYSPILTWIDMVKPKENIVERKIQGLSCKIIYSNENKISEEINYKLKVLAPELKDFDKTMCIGSLDIESYLGSDSQSIPCAIAAKVNNNYYVKHLNDLPIGQRNSDTMIFSLLDDLLVPANHNSYLYCHNLGKYDGLFIIDALLNIKAGNYLSKERRLSTLDRLSNSSKPGLDLGPDGFRGEGSILEPNPERNSSRKKPSLVTSCLESREVPGDLRVNIKVDIFSNKANEILSITIRKIMGNKKVIKIHILDSMNYLKGSLSDVGKSFGVTNNKSIFPHDFLRADTLNYIGPVPDINYFPEASISMIDYNNYKSECNNVWNCKEELLQYLKRDVDVLYEIMDRFSRSIYDLFNVKLTRTKTLSGLSFLIFKSNFYRPGSEPIYLSKGVLDRFIRKGYYGGLVDVVENYYNGLILEFDVISHYPNSSKKPMPGGNARISNDKNLDNIFGFIFAKVTAPTKDELKVAILPHRTDMGSVSIFRGTTTGVWFSEELKNAVKYGYKVEIISCIKFDKVNSPFIPFVDTLSKLKNEAELKNNLVERYLYKLILNSLIGLLGKKRIEEKLQIVDKDKYDKLSLKHEVSLVKSYPTANSCLINLGKPTNELLYNALKADYPEIDSNMKNDMTSFEDSQPWGSVLSGVQYAAATTAYARIDISKYKNIPGIDYLYGDTDSGFFTKPLPEEFVGSGLGQMKLKNVFKEGYFIAKKLYCCVRENEETVIKAKGVGVNVDTNKSILSKSDFETLLKGDSVTINKLHFNRDWKEMKVFIKKENLNIRGLLLQGQAFPEKEALTGKELVEAGVNNANNPLTSRPNELNNILCPISNNKPLDIKDNADYFGRKETGSQSSYNGVRSKKDSYLDPGLGFTEVVEVTEEVGDKCELLKGMEMASRGNKESLVGAHSNLCGKFLIPYKGLEIIPSPFSLMGTVFKMVCRARKENRSLIPFPGPKGIGARKENMSLITYRKENRSLIPYTHSLFSNPLKLYNNSFLGKDSKDSGKCTDKIKKLEKLFLLIQK